MEIVVKKETVAEVEKELGEGALEKFKEVGDDEAEESGAVVCVRREVKVQFTDNEFGRCIECGHEVQFRPSAPKKPPRVCVECLPAFMAAVERAKRNKENKS